MLNVEASVGAPLVLAKNEIQNLMGMEASYLADDHHVKKASAQYYEDDVGRTREGASLVSVDVEGTPSLDLDNHTHHKVRVAYDDNP